MRRRIRIGTLFQTLHIGGDENRTANFAQHYDRNEFELTVFCMITPSPERDRIMGPMSERYRDLGVQCVFLDEAPRSGNGLLPRPLALGRDALRMGRIAFRLARLFRRFRIDVVDAKMTYAILFAALARYFHRVPVVFATEYFCSDWWLEGPQRVLAPRAFANVDLLISDSQAALDSLEAHFGPRLPKTAVVKNGIAKPQPSCGIDEARRRLGLPLDPAIRVVGAVAKLLPFKGQNILLEAAARVLRECPETHFLCCGYPGKDGDFDTQLRQQSVSLGIADRVTITGYPGPIGDVWQCIDLHVHPSTMDSSPISIHEGMAMGRPAVLTSAGGIPELAHDGETCLMVAPGDAGALADAIVRVLGKPDLAERLGKAARLRYEAHHRPEQMVGALQDLMRKAYAASTRGSRAMARSADSVV